MNLLHILCTGVFFSWPKICKNTRSLTNPGVVRTRLLFAPRVDNSASWGTHSCALQCGGGNWEGASRQERDGCVEIAARCWVRGQRHSLVRIFFCLCGFCSNSMTCRVLCRVW